MAGIDAVLVYSLATLIMDESMSRANGLDIRVSILSVANFFFKKKNPFLGSSTHG